MSVIASYIKSGSGGTGLQGYVARWATDEELSTGVIRDSGNNVGIGIDPSDQYLLYVGGVARFTQSIIGITEDPTENSQKLATTAWVKNLGLGSALSFSNGLTVTSGTVKLGGSLTMDTDINLNGKIIKFHNLNGYMSWDGERLLFSPNSDTTNMLMGYDAAYNSPGSNLLAWGRSALIDGGGNNKIAIGIRAGRQNIGHDNIFIGNSAGEVSNGDYNTIIGQLGAYLTNTSHSTMIGAITRHSKVLGNVTISTSNIIVEESSPGVYTSSKIGGLAAFFSSIGLTTAYIGAFEVIFSGGTAPLVNDGLGRRQSYTEKGEIKDSDTLELYQGKFADKGSGNMTIIAYENLVNTVVIGYDTYADRSNQVALGGNTTSQLLINKFRLNTSTVPANNEFLCWDAASGETIWRDPNYYIHKGGDVMTGALKSVGSTGSIISPGNGSRTFQVYSNTYTDDAFITFEKQDGNISIGERGYIDRFGLRANDNNFWRGRYNENAAEAAALNQNYMFFDTKTLQFGAGISVSIGSDNVRTISVGSFSETDPVFMAHVAHNITSTDISNWNAAETDPVFMAHVAHNITSTNINNWNTAYNKRVVSAAFTGTTTKILTLTLSDGTTPITASFDDASGSGGGGITSITLNTDDVLYDTPVSFTVTGSSATGSLVHKKAPTFGILCGPDAVSDGIPDYPSFKFITHSYISDWVAELDKKADWHAGGVTVTPNATYTGAATSSANIHSSASAGLITITTGTVSGGASAKDLCTVALGFDYLNVPFVIITPYNEEAAGLGLYVFDSGSSTGFNIRCKTPFVSSTTYKFSYMVVSNPM
jgi:hypothetical protein